MPVRKVASMAACLLASTRIDAGERFTALYETTKLVKCVIMLDGWLESRGIRSFLVVLIVSLNKLQHSCNPFFQFEILSFFFSFSCFSSFSSPLGIHSSPFLSAFHVRSFFSRRTIEYIMLRLSPNDVKTTNGV